MKKQNRPTTKKRVSDIRIQVLLTGESAQRFQKYQEATFVRQISVAGYQLIMRGLKEFERSNGSDGEK